MSIFRLICRCLFRKKTICCILIFFILGCVFTIYLTLLSYTKCSYIEVENAVFSICDKFRNREALGNLCIDLCELQTLKPNNCLTNHAGKDVVFQASYYDEPVVVKSSKLNLEDFDQIFYINSDGNKINPSIPMFYSMIANTVKSHLMIDIALPNNQSLEILSKLWTRNMNNFPQLPSQLQNAAMNNIWFLIQQSEYLLMKYYEDENIFPKILGTCGPFYTVEFIKPLDNYFMMFYPTWKEDFLERAELALKLLNFLEDVERRFRSLHFCDVKVGHFGMNKNSEIKLLDMDMVFFEQSLIKNIVAITNCSKNRDCSFIDCLGSCNVVSRQCEARVLDNNFQRVCRNILSGRLMQSYFGLLSSPPSSISKELNSMLKRCSGFLNDMSSHILASELKFLLDSIVKTKYLSHI